MTEKDIFIGDTKKLRNERLTIEYKETFNFGSLAKYFKTLMAFAFKDNFSSVKYYIIVL